MRMARNKRWFFRYRQLSLIRTRRKGKNCCYTMSISDFRRWRQTPAFIVRLLSTKRERQKRAANFFTDVLNDVREQGLIVKERRGGRISVGCAHLDRESLVRRPRVYSPIWRWSNIGCCLSGIENDRTNTSSSKGRLRVCASEKIDVDQCFGRGKGQRNRGEKEEKKENACAAGQKDEEEEGERERKKEIP